MEHHTIRLTHLRWRAVMRRQASERRVSKARRHITIQLYIHDKQGKCALLEHWSNLQSLFSAKSLQRPWQSGQYSHPRRQAPVKGGASTYDDS